MSSACLPEEYRRHRENKFTGNTCEECSKTATLKIHNQHCHQHSHDSKTWTPENYINTMPPQPRSPSSLPSTLSTKTTPHQPPATATTMRTPNPDTTHLPPPAVRPGARYQESLWHRLKAYAEGCLLATATMHNKPAPYAVCPICLDTELCIAGVRRALSRPEHRYRPGIALVCGHMTCARCWQA